MKKFIGKVAALSVAALVIVSTLIVAIYYLTPNAYKDNYQHGFRIQYDAIKNAPADERKIICVGGSYVTFGVDPEVLTELTGYNCYDLGVQSSMGMCYTFEKVEELIKPGDIVVYPFEEFRENDYGMDLIYLTMDGSTEWILDFAKKHPDVFARTVPKAAYLRVAGLLRNVIAAGSLEPEQIYKEEYFDAVTSNYELDRPEVIETEEFFKAIEDRYTRNLVEDSCFKVLNQFNATCEKNGAKFVLAYAPRAELAVKSSAEEIEDFEAFLHENVDCDIICSLNECLIPYEYLYNNSMHLNNDGTVYYTSLLAKWLEDYL